MALTVIEVWGVEAGEGRTQSLKLLEIQLIGHFVGDTERQTLSSNPPKVPQTPKRQRPS